MATTKKRGAAKAAPKPEERVDFSRMTISARYRGSRKLEWTVVGDPRRYFVWISANPAAIDPRNLDAVFQLPPAGVQRGDDGWFEAVRQDGAKWRRIALQAFARASAERLFTPHKFAKADATRVVEAEAYRRSMEMFGVLRQLLAEYEATPSDQPVQLPMMTVAMGLVGDIEAAGNLTYETVSKALTRAMGNAK